MFTFAPFAYARCTGAAANPYGLTGSDTNAKPIRVAALMPWRPKRRPLRWARRRSVRLDWEPRQWPPSSAVLDRRSRELEARSTAPARLAGWRGRLDISQN